MIRFSFSVALTLSLLLVVPSASFTQVEQWNRKADMMGPRLFFSASASNGLIYVMGGMLAQVIPSTHAFNPSTDEWSLRADMPTARAGMSSAVVDGKIYVIGGWTDTEPAISTVEEYDPATDTWIQRADMPTARGLFSTATVNGKIYAIGGIATNLGPVSGGG